MQNEKRPQQNPVGKKLPGMSEAESKILDDIFGLPTTPEPPLRESITPAQPVPPLTREDLQEAVNYVVDILDEHQEIAYGNTISSDYTQMSNTILTSLIQVHPDQFRLHSGPNQWRPIFQQALDITDAFIEHRNQVLEQLEALEQE